MDQQDLFVGIDVSKDRLDVGVWPSGELWVESNTAEGVATLVERLRAMEPQLVVLEATGGLETPVLEALLAASLPAVAVNPRQVRDFAKATGRLAKTDPLDALALAHFGAAIRPTVRALPAEDVRELDHLVTRRRQLVGMMAQEKNRMHRAPDSVRANIEDHIQWLQKQIDELDKGITEIIKANRELNDKATLLESFKGVGLGCASTLLAKLPELGTLDRGKIASLAGLAPLNCDSGKYKGTRRIWGGRESVRSALYMAALVAIRWNPVIKKFHARLKQKGKKSKVIITACMRKILVILNAMIKSGETWRPALSH